MSPALPLTPLRLAPLLLAPLLLALSSRPGTTATPCLSAAWANAPLSAGPAGPAGPSLLGRRTHKVSPPAGSGQVHSGRAARSAPVSASCLARSHSPRHLTMSSCPSFSRAAVIACWNATLPRSAAALTAATRAIRPALALIQPVRRPPQYSLDSEPMLTRFGCWGLKAASGGGGGLSQSGSSASVMSSTNSVWGCRAASRATRRRCPVGMTRPVGL